MKKKLISLLLLLAFVSIAYALEDVLVKSRIAKSNDIASLDHFCLHPMDDAKSKHLLELHPEMENWIIGSITDVLEERGYDHVANYECALEVAYEVRVHNQALLHSARIAHGDTVAERLDLIPERTLILHAHDLHFGKTVWIATAEEAVFDSDYHKQMPEVVKARLDEAIEKMFERFPASQS